MRQKEEERRSRKGGGGNERRERDRFDFWLLARSGVGWAEWAAGAANRCLRLQIAPV